MLRVFSAKIFREDLSQYALPMWAFENFEDVETRVQLDSGTYKFCLPVSIGDFPETNVPACFSNNVKELKEFVKTQSELNHRKAFIISDFLVSDISDICYSGIMRTDSKLGISDYINKSTTISVTFKNPILTYAQEGVSPRDLPADIQLYYDHVSNPCCAFPKIETKKENFDLGNYKDVIYQAYMAAAKIHKVAEEYDGLEYSEYALFFIDNKHRVKLYEIIGEESFLGKAICDEKAIRKELNCILRD